jgi:predicted nucleic acid-binding protein
MRKEKVESTSVSKRYRTWLENARQIPLHFEQGDFIVEPLHIEGLLLRKQIEEHYGIGRGEAACIVLASRHGARGVLLSSDAEACVAAQAAGLDFLCLPDILVSWIDNVSPTRATLDTLLHGMRQAKFGLSETLTSTLEQRLSR